MNHNNDDFKQVESCENAHVKMGRLEFWFENLQSIVNWYKVLLLFEYFLKENKIKTKITLTQIIIFILGTIVTYYEKN